MQNDKAAAQHRVDSGDSPHQMEFIVRPGSVPFLRGVQACAALSCPHGENVGIAQES